MRFRINLEIFFTLFAENELERPVCLFVISLNNVTKKQTASQTRYILIDTAHKIC